MPIITSNQAKNFEKIRIQVPTNLLEEVKNYCQAFNVLQVEDFFNEATKHVLKTDKDWKKIIKKT